MNYERMWNSLKKVIYGETYFLSDEETDILSEENKNDSTSFVADELEAQYNEADYIAGEMEAIETRELLLQTKEKGETGK